VRRLLEKFGEGHVYVAQVDEILGGLARVSGARLAHLDPLDAATLAGRPRVRVDCAGASWSVERDVFYIGRGIESVHLYVPSPMLSRVHARILWSAAEGWLFEDCKSEDGSYFGGERVDRRPLRDGDAYALGTSAVTLRFALRQRR
jgi:hypothetical protein